VKLYVFPVAPNPTRVRLYLAEKAAAGGRLAVDEIPVNLPKGEQQSPEHRARSPFGTVPVLELDDGELIPESLAIVEYLEECHPEPPLIGRSPVERARVRVLERIVETRVLMPLARLVHAERSPLGLAPDPAVAARVRTALPQGLAYLDAVLADGRPFLAGERPTIADCTLAAALQFGRFGGQDPAPEFAHLHRWDRAYRDRPCVREVVVV